MYSHCYRANNLLTKYEILDSTTLENIVHALCHTSQWKKSLKCLDDIKVSAIPTASAYSVIIDCALRDKDQKLANKLLSEMVENGKNPKCHVFITWISQCQKLNDSSTALVEIEEMLNFISENEINISKNVADKLREFFADLEIRIESAKVNRR